MKDPLGHGSNSRGYQTGDGRTHADLPTAIAHAGSVFKKSGVVISVEQKGIHSAAINSLPTKTEVRTAYQTGDGRTHADMPSAIAHAGSVFKKSGVVISVEKKG